MSGRINDPRGKKRSGKKTPGKKPNAHRQRQLAQRRRKIANFSQRWHDLKAAGMSVPADTGQSGPAAG